MLKHGLEIDAAGRPVWLRYGVLRLMQHLLALGFEPKPARPDLARHFRQRYFLHNVQAFQACFWKFDRAAGYVERCRASIEQWVEGEARDDVKGIKIDDPAFVSCHNAISDLPLHLDSMLFYLRIQADVFAKLMRHLYERRQNIPDSSFRKQAKWFLNTQPDFDLQYRAVLQSNLGWFDTLAGKAASGLRDVVVHRSGTHQLGWAVPDERTAFALRAGLITHSGFVEEDLISAIRGITLGWCAFLDVVWDLLIPRLADAVLESAEEPDLHSRFLQSGGRELPSFWVYPRAAQPRNAPERQQPASPPVAAR